jgi:hypothetical protein
MKFGHVYKERLRSEGFPADWVDASISYGQLKKCIGRLTSELAQVGLDPVTLGKLLKHVEDYNAAAESESNNDEKPFEYILSGEDPSTSENDDGSDPAKRHRKPFHPKLLFYVNEATGKLQDAKIDEETRRKLQMLAVATGMSDLRVMEEDPEDAEAKSVTSQDSGDDSATHACTSATGTTKRPEHRVVEIPLSSDIEFFTKLTSELSGLEALQEREEKKLNKQIEDLGSQIARLTDPSIHKNKKILGIWRNIFQIYVESDIFFGTTEVDHQAHTAEQAIEKFQKFSVSIVDQGLVSKFKKEERLQALNAFMQINREIIHSLQFGEINRTAMNKILKKFDKRTALGVKKTFPQKIQYPDFSERLGKAVCAEVHNQILSHVPRLDDYTCPMCMEIKWRPVKLRCSHVFCIRCLIVMQNNKQGRCPLCREKTVTEANSDNLDLEMARFLSKWFPDEVKAKQKYNEVMAGVDQYGEVYKDKPCYVM